MKQIHRKQNFCKKRKSTLVNTVKQETMMLQTHEYWLTNTQGTAFFLWFWKILIRLCKFVFFYQYGICNTSHVLYTKTLLLQCICFWRIFLFSIYASNSKYQENTSIDSLLTWECTPRLDSHLFDRDLDIFTKNWIICHWLASNGLILQKYQETLTFFNM